MGASLTMIDRHYGHLARDGREHAITLLDASQRARVDAVDAGGRSRGRSNAASRASAADNGKRALEQAENVEAL